MSTVACEPLESRTLLSVALKSDGSLAVIGTDGADIIGLKVVGSTLRVDFNGSLTTYGPSDILAIGIDLRDGNDLLGIGAGITGVYVLGGLGDDTITGGLAADTITAGGGRDLVDGSQGDDRIDGGPSPDRLIGGEGADRIYGRDANDVMEGNGGVDRLFAGADNDALFGGSSNDKLYGDDGNDTLAGNNQNDLLTGGAGDDAIYASDGRDTLIGNDGADTLLGQADADTLFGDGGNDLLNGGGGSDALDGGGDTDTIASSDGDDIATGGAGDDEVYGEFGNDFVDGGDGHDLVTGGPDSDTVNGGVGNDAVFGSLGRDTLNGNAGADRYLQWNGDVITGNTDADSGITFLDDNSAAWTPDEIVDIDRGFAWVVARTGNTRLLRQHDGGGVTIRRERTLGASTLAINAGDGRISIADLAFDSGEAASTIVHELAHNFDEPAENLSVEQFRAISGWRIRSGTWTYSNAPAGFAAEYGKTNAYEDFATAMEVYFTDARPASQWQQKWSHIDTWLDAMSS